MELNQRSRKALEGVHPDLVRVVELAASRCEVPIVVTEGLRNLERQAALKAAGKSWTLNSRHLTGHAVDVVDGDNWGYDIPDLDKIADEMKKAAEELKVPLVWGGDWKSRDTPHFELCRKAYPASGVSTATKVAEATGVIARTRGVIAGAVGTGAVVVTEATQAVKAVDAPLIPAVPPGVTETLKNLSGWSGAIPQQSSMLLIGALAFGLVALVSWGIQKARQ